MIIFFILLSPLAIGQNNTTENNYVKLIVNNVLSSSDAVIIDNYMRQQPGIVMSRMDYRTSVYFCTYKASSNITIDLIRAYIINLGFFPKCSVSGNHGGVIPTKHIDKKMCKDSLITTK